MKTPAGSYLKIFTIPLMLTVLTLGIFFFASRTKKEQDIKPGYAALQGDCNTDGKVDILDFQLISNTFGKSSGQAGYNSKCDFNSDSKVDVLDFQIMSNNFGQSGSLSPTASVPTPTSGPAGSGLSQVDPSSDTDNYVNSFLKSRIKAGDKRVIANGVWWGPVGKFFEDQLWAVMRNTPRIGGVYSSGSQIPISFTCLEPGKIGGHGTARNGLNLPHQSISIDSNNIKGTKIALEQYWDTSITAGTSGDHELRIRCDTTEGVTNGFGDGTPTSGDRVFVNLDPNIWFGSDGGRAAVHASYLNNDLYDLHGWYQDIEYIYGFLDGACSNGPCASNLGNLTNEQLVSNPAIKGQFTLYSAISKLGPGGVDIHHTELRIENNNEDYTVVGTKQISPPISTDPTVGGALNIGSRRLSFTFDTRLVPDGWHILSWHFHLIDARTPGSATYGHQFAGEIKIPVCIQNGNTNVCN